MITLVCLTSAFFQAGQPTDLGGFTQPVSFHQPAAPLSRLLVDLGKAASVDLAASPSSAADVAVLDCSAKPLKIVLAKLAELDGGEWQTFGKQIRLVRTPRLAKAEEDRERTERAKDVATEIAALQGNSKSELTASAADKLAAKLADQGERVQQSYTPYASGAIESYRSPMQRALIRTLALLNPKDVSLMAQGDVIVYASNPKRLQLQLPAGEDSVLAQLATEQAIWSESVSKLHLPPSSGPRFANDPLNQADPFISAPKQALLVARRSNSMSPVVYNYYVLDADRSSLGFAQIWLTPESVRQQRALFEGAGPSKDEDSLKLTPESLAYGDAFKVWFTRDPAADMKLTNLQKKLIANPDTIEPLGLSPTEGLLAKARLTKSDLIGVLPDDLLLSGLLLGATRPTLTGFLKSATTIGMVDVVDRDGWTVVSPQRPFSCRRERVSRLALGRYLRSIASTGYSTLAEESKYALDAREADYDVLGLVLGSLFDQYQTQNIDKDWPTLRFYGSLTEPQRVALEAGKALAFSELSSEQQAIVGRKMATQGATRWSAPARANSSDLRNDAEREPTELLANGLTDSVRVRMKAVSEPMAIASQTSGKFKMGFQRVFNAAALGQHIFSATRPGGENGPTMPIWDLFQMGHQTGYTFTFEYSPRASNGAEIFDRAPDPNSKPMKLEMLPEAFRKAVEAGIAAARSAPQPVGATAGPPPPKL